jgi:Protein of unknown function (DUF2946)
MKLLEKRVFRRTLGVVIAVTQLVVVVATATDSLRASASAHVEQSGTRRHFAHNEATCPLCAAQSMHAQVARSPAPVPSKAPPLTASVQRVNRTFADPTPAANGSRAPPTLS